jgi:hypothetical protein
MTRDEERAREIVDAPRWDNKNDLIHRIAQALARERAEENEACQKLVCFGCKVGYPIIVGEKAIWHEVGDLRKDCQAAAIRARQT